MSTRLIPCLACVLVLVAGACTDDDGNDGGQELVNGSDDEGGCAYSETVTLSGEALLEWVDTGQGTTIDCQGGGSDGGGPAEVDPAVVTDEVCAAICASASGGCDELELGNSDSCSYGGFDGDVHEIMCNWHNQSCV